MMNWECASLDFKTFITLYFNISQLLILEYFWWYVRNILSSVHMALFILARRRAKLSPLQKQICGADRGKVCLKSLD